MIMSINFLLWICCLDFGATSSLDRVHSRRDNVSKKNHDSSPVTKWCQPSRSTTCKNGNIFFAYSFHLWKNYCSTDVAPNTKGTIWIQWIHANAATLPIACFAVSQRSNEMIQMAISLKFPKFCCQDHLEEVVRCEFRHAGLDDRVVSLQSRIGLFEADRNVR
jgi:hypothetical protein